MKIPVEYWCVHPSLSPLELVLVELVKEEREQDTTGADLGSGKETIFPHQTKN